MLNVKAVSFWILKRIFMMLPSHAPKFKVYFWCWVHCFIVNPIIQFLKQLILGPQIFEKLKAFHIPDFIEAVKFDFVLILAIFYKENLLDYVPHNKDATKWVWQNIEEA